MVKGVYNIYFLLDTQNNALYSASQNHLLCATNPDGGPFNCANIKSPIEHFSLNQKDYLLLMVEHYVDKG